MAAKKTKKVTYANLTELMKTGEPEKVELKLNDDITLYVKRNLTFEEVCGFIRDVVGIVINRDTGDYYPQALNYALFAAVLNYYAGVPLEGKGSEKAYEILHHSDVFYNILDVIDADQYDQDIVEAIDARIKFEKTIIAAAQTQKLNEFMSKMEAVFSEGQTLIEKIQAPEFADTMKLMAQAAEAVEK